MPKKSTKSTTEVLETNNILNLEALVKEDAKFTQKEIEVKGYKILIDEQFRTTKIHELVTELLEKVKLMKERKIEMDVSEYLIILIIKHFTSLDISNKFEEQIKMFKLLLDHDYLELILKAIDSEEIKKIYVTMSKMNENVENFKNELLTNPYSINHELLGTYIK